MPNWHEIGEELKQAGSTFDVIRRRYLKDLSVKTGRNVILYYSGWLQKNNIDGLQVNDADKNGLMTVIHKLDRTKGLDLILHTPGGETAATESIVDYLHSISKLIVDCIEVLHTTEGFALEKSTSMENPNGSIFESLHHLLCNMTSVPLTVLVSETAIGTYWSPPPNNSGGDVSAVPVRY